MPGTSANELVMTFDILWGGAGEHELKSHPELMSQYKALKVAYNGFLVEVFDNHTGAYLRGVVTEVRHGAWRGEAETLRARAFGDFALVQGALGSTIVYRFSTGARIGEVFGDIVAEDAVAGLFAVSNRDNDLLIYDASTIRERKHLTYAAPISFAEFLPSAKELLVLTDDQKLHAISMEDLLENGTPAHP